MKTPILLLHGALGSQESLEEIKQILEPEYPVFSITFKGHGNTAKKRTIQFSDFVAQINDFLLSNRIEMVTIFGYSMGGYAGLLFAHTFPEKVKSIFTLGTKFEWSPEIAQREVLKLNPETIRLKVPRFADYLTRLHGDKWDDLCHSTSDLLRSLGENPLLSPSQLRSIDCPVNILLGENDQMVSQSESIEAAKNLKNGTFTLIPDQPHPIEKVNPEKLKMVLTSLL